MDQQPKPVSGSSPLNASNNPRNLEATETANLIWGLFPKHEQVEKVLVDREARYQEEIEKLRREIEMEKLMRIQAEVNREEQCKMVKKKEETLDMVINRNLYLEVENSKLRELEKIWMGEKNKNERLERKIEELNERVVNLEEVMRLLMSNEKKPIAEPVVSVVVNAEKHVRDNAFGIGIAPLQGNEDTQPPEKGNKDSVVALGSARGKLKPKNAVIINLDDDEDQSMSQELHGNKATSQIVPEIESSVVQKQNITATAQMEDMLKRTFTCSGIDISGSSSSSDVDNLPKGILGLGSNKKSKI